MGNEYKVGIVSDIHSNYVALKAVFDEFEKLNLDEIIVAGDIIGGFTQPNQTIDIIKSSSAKVIHGNREDYLRDYLDGMHSNWSKFHQMKPVTWTNTELTQENKNYLLNLPSKIIFTTMGASIIVVHGSPRRVNELIYKHEIDKIKEALASVSEDILICGHNHQQWSNKVDGTLIVNPGSAGLSFRKGGMAPYTILSYKEGVWSVKEKLASYDTGETRRAFESSGAMYYKPWENMLMHSIEDGKVATLAFLNYVKKFAISNGWDGKVNLIPNEYWHKANETFDWEGFEYKSKAKRD